MQSCSPYKATPRYYSPKLGAQEHTFEPEKWWLEAVQAACAVRGVKAQLVRAWRAKYKDIAMDEPKLGRAISGVRTQITVAVRISALLGLPPPIFVPKSPDEARALMAEVALRTGIDPKTAEIRAGVEDDENERHPTEVGSPDGRAGKRTKRGRVDGSRPRTP